jgi:hypothetical protein
MTPDPDGTNPDPTPAEGEDQTPKSGPPIPLPRGINCCKCSYELHGLTRDARCPECATPIEDSLKSDALYFSPPDYLRRLRMGAEMTVWGAFAWLVIPVLGWCLLRALRSFLSGGSAADLFAVAIGFLLHASAWLILCRGVWLLTTPDEQRAQVQRNPRARPLARWILIVSYGIEEITIAVFLLAPTLQANLASFFWIMLPPIALGWILLLHVVANYYRRCSEPRLAKGVTVAITTISTTLALLVVSLLSWGTMTLMPLPGVILFGILLLFVPLVMFVLSGFSLLLSFIVLVELGSWINKARMRSEAIRAAAGPDAPFFN